MIDFKNFIILCETIENLKVSKINKKTVKNQEWYESIDDVFKNHFIKNDFNPRGDLYLIKNEGVALVEFNADGKQGVCDLLLTVKFKNSKTHGFMEKILFPWIKSNNQHKIILQANNEKLLNYYINKLGFKPVSKKLYNDFKNKIGDFKNGEPFYGYLYKNI